MRPSCLFITAIIVFYCEIEASSAILHQTLPLNINRKFNQYKWIPSIQKKSSYTRARRALLPFFDGVPGDLEYMHESPSIFIFNAIEGELIVNTMLSGRKYPLQEPVPGQVLNPPKVPKFSARTSRKRRPTFNVTMIPFYAHEAINPNFIHKAKNIWRRGKENKHYMAYHSAHDVNWQPTIANLPLKNNMPSPFYKARPTESNLLDQGQMTAVPEATTNPFYKSNNSDDNQRLHIVYFEESLETPTSPTTKEPLMSSRYSVAKKQVSPKELQQKLYNKNKLYDSKESFRDKEANADTWFILNSRYKGQYMNVNNLRECIDKSLETNSKTIKRLDFEDIKSVT